METNWKNRITPDLIKILLPGHIFGFGSNLSGRHGKGAAKTAMGWGAIYGQAAGLQGRTYGIPTKDRSVTRTLSLVEIKPYVDDFIEFAKNHPELTFLMTKIGTGLANRTIEEISLLFIEAKYIQNIFLPIEFWLIINGLPDSYKV